MNLTELEQTAPLGYQITRRPRFGANGDTVIGYYWRVEFQDYEHFYQSDQPFTGWSTTSLDEAVQHALDEYRHALAGGRRRREP